MRLLNAARADAITELLTTLTVRSSVYCLSELRAPWGFEVSGANVAKFHLVLEGACVLQAGGAAPVRLAAGDLVILPHGDRHDMRDAPGSPVLGLDRLIADHPLDEQGRLRCGTDGPVTRLLCGGFALGREIPVSVRAELPPVMHLDAVSAGAFAWLEPVFALLGQEADRPGPGAQAMFAKLSDVFLAQALRSYLAGAEQTEQTEQPGVGQPGARADPLIDAAVTLIRDHAARQWTVQALAREVGMSRTLFTTRFRAATGESPMRHLARVRLVQAADYLATTKLSVEAIARRTGYSTSAALSKAFKREFEISPGRYRESRGTTQIENVV
jgi:AraC-like DNA-binding protein